MHRNLQAPLRPTSAPADDSDEDDGGYRNRGSLSDYSDYASSDEETHNRASGSGAHAKTRGYAANEDEEVDVRRDPKRGLLVEEDPFADPFEDDDGGVGTPGIRERKLNW